MSYNIGDEVVFANTRRYRITNLGETECTLTQVDTHAHYPYSYEKLNRRISLGEITLIPKKTSMKSKNSGPEMQYCPFCEAAWVNEDVNKQVQKCKFCGSRLY